MNGAAKTVRLPVNLEERRFVGSLAKRLAASEGDPKVLMYWLGQAGFVFQAGGRRLLIDPYLSDTLADKYRGSATPHERMASPPIDLRGLGKVDLVLATHHHTDHMDPGNSRRRLRKRNRPCSSLFRGRAARRRSSAPGASRNRLVLLDAGETIEPWPGLSVVALRAAHETLERDEEGNHRFLGYGLAFGQAGTARRHGDSFRRHDPVRRAGGRDPASCGRTFCSCQ